MVKMRICAQLTLCCRLLDVGRKAYLLLVALLCCTCAWAQVFPSENKQLHYRYVPFTVKEHEVLQNATLEIAVGAYYDLDSFKKNIIKRVPCKGMTTIVEVPFFGKPYTWAVNTPKNRAKPSDLRHFATLSVPEIDTAFYRLRIEKNTAFADPFYVFCDGNKVLYDHLGSAIWFLPEIPHEPSLNVNMYGLAMSSAGTITLMMNAHIYEMDWHGNLLWKGPNDGKVSGDSVERYHHEFTRLNNDHYMVLGSELIKVAAHDRFLPSPKPLKATPKPQSSEKSSLLINMGTIIEYDAQGKVVWSWKTYPYLQKTLLKNNPHLLRPDMTHENAFYFDQQRRFIYLSLKNTNQILKIKYPQGTVEGSYGGPVSATDIVDDKIGLFCQQHSCKLTKKGDLYLFNNNMCKLNEPPNLLVFSGAPSQTTTPTVKWGYPLPYNWDKETNNRRKEGTSGGNVQELKDGQFFISMFKPFGDMYVVNQEKEIRWHGVLEKKQPQTGEWIPQEQYRATVIDSRSDLERLVLGGK